jgi:hypothetical protein
MLPKEAPHVTDLSEVVPRTEAVNWSVPVVIEEAVEGETVTEVTTGLGGGATVTAVTFTVAEANLVGSALLLAVTVAVPGLEGAV